MDEDHEESRLDQRASWTSGDQLERIAEGIERTLSEQVRVRGTRKSGIMTMVDILQYFLKIGGCFTLSDDSHGLPQVGLNFSRSLSYLQTVGVTRLHYLERDTMSGKAQILQKSVSLVEVSADHHPSSA